MGSRISEWVEMALYSLHYRLITNNKELIYSRGQASAAWTVFYQRPTYYVATRKEICSFHVVSFPYVMAGLVLLVVNYVRGNDRKRTWHHPKVRRRCV
jgi:hypothetical protein